MAALATHAARHGLVDRRGRERRDRKRACAGRGLKARRLAGSQWSTKRYLDMALLADQKLARESAA